MTEFNTVTVTESKQGGRIALLDGFRYNQRTINKTGSIQWRCRIVGCKASITTSAAFVVMRGDTTHTHDKQETGLNEANQLARGMRKRAREGLTPLPQIYEKERGKIITTDLGTSPAEVSGKLPFFSSIKTQLYRQRHFLIFQSAKDANDIIINDEWSQTESGEHFILIDDISEESRIIVFGTNDSSRRQCASDIVSIYGTFKVCPRVFYQLYVIHSHMYGTVLPELFCLLPDKKAAPYRRLLALLITNCAEREYCLKPATIIVDFELAVHNVVQTLFPASSLKGCLFHFGQAL